MINFFILKSQYISVNKDMTITVDHSVKIFLLIFQLI